MTQRPWAVVSGAARGIGAAAARALAQAGFNLALLDRAEEAMAQLACQVQAAGGQARCYGCDLAQAETLADLVTRIGQQCGAIQCLVNNAGIGAVRRGDLLDVTLADFDQVHRVNCRGTFFLTQAVARQMCEVAPADARLPRSLITISSVSAEMASIERGDYCLSKSGLAMLTKLFALRLAEHKIGVFEIRPGMIRTAMTEPVAQQYGERIAAGLVPMRRWGAPEDVAQAVVALAGGGLSFATGSVLHVDGGLSIARL